MNMNFYHYMGLIKNGGVLLFHSINQQIRKEWIAKYNPVKPTVIQFPVNDICNSRCIMCNIWQRKKGKEITTYELERILKDPLFDKIKYVGINGGEPTLRTDLPNIGEILINSLPKLQGIGIITNALNHKIVIERILQLAQVAKSANISFNVSISLDGIGDDHDRNRGVKGNYISAIKVIEALKQAKLPISIGYTLTPLNCYGADDVLLWCEQNDISNCEFRLGVEIKRIYNQGYTQQYQFTPEQYFHLIMFFDKLGHNPCVDNMHRRFYNSLVKQLAFKLPRQARCDWQWCGVTLDSRGDISYCSVQSPILGSALEKSAWEIYKTGMPIRQRIIKDYCDNCHHDLLGLPSIKELFKEDVYIITNQCIYQWRKLITLLIPFVNKFQPPKVSPPVNHNSPSKWQHVLITGWYGTETAGDKAILGELLHFLKKNNKECKITLTTLDYKVSQQTKLELVELEGVMLVNMKKAHDPALIKSVDAVIIGGGPLEEIGQMEYIWRMFVEANRQRKARIIFGCGIGPLHSNRLRQMVGAICQMTTAGFLRDEESYNYAIKFGASAPLGCACDPALAYIKRWADNSRRIQNRNGTSHIVGLVRANTNEYVVDLTEAELKELNNKVARKISDILEPICRINHAKIDMLPMHTIWMGGDDRIFNRQIAGFFRDSGNIHVERRYLRLEELLQSLYSADIAIAMRYHGHLFCMALGIPFLSIDYTGKPGKVHSLIKRIDYEQWCEEWKTLNTNRATSRMQQLLEEYDHFSSYLQRKTDELVDELYQTYNQVFDMQVKLQ